MSNLTTLATADGDLLLDGIAGEPVELPVDPGSDAAQSEIDDYMAALAALVSGYVANPGPGATGSIADGGFFDNLAMGAFPYVKVILPADDPLLDANGEYAAHSENPIKEFDLVWPDDTSARPNTETIYLDSVFKSDPTAGSNLALRIRGYDSVFMKYGDPLLVPGAVIRVQIGTSNAILQGVDLYVPGASQQDTDAYAAFIAANPGLPVDPGPLGGTVTAADRTAYRAALRTYIENSSGGGLSLLLRSNVDALADRMRLSFALRKGACPYDLTAGFAHERTTGIVNETLVYSLVREHVRNLPGVASVDSVSVDIDPATRTMEVSAEITDSTGEPVTITFNTLSI